MVKNYFAFALALSLIFVVILSGTGQTTGRKPITQARPQRYDEVILPRELRGRKTIPAAVDQGPDCLTPYMPASNAPPKTICINLNIFQKSDGSGNYQNTVMDIANLTQVITWVNGFYQNCTPTDTCPGVSPAMDTQIRFSLRNIYFYQNNNLWNSSNYSQLLNAVFTAHPEAKQQLNILLVADSSQPNINWAQASPPTTVLSQDQFITLFNSYIPGPFANWGAAGLLAHELGHTLDLLHPYPVDPSKGQGCCPESCDTNSCEYLSDVFCPPTNPCLQEGYWGCDPNLTSNTCTNNMMGQTQAACYFSPLQIAKMHKALTVKSAQKYLLPCGGCGDCVVRPANIMLWLPFDETSGANATDISAYANSGLLHGNPNHLIPGNVSNGLCFDGIDDYVEVLDKPQINIGIGNFSIDFWIKFNSADNVGTRSILDKRQSAPLIGYHIAVINGSLWLQLANGVGTSWTNYPSNINVADGQWHLIAVTVERNSVSGIRWYKDGSPVVPVSTAAINPMGRSGSLNNSKPLLIGRQGFSSQGYFNGCIDELEILNRVLTENEILSIFRAGPDGKCK